MELTLCILRSVTTENKSRGITFHILRSLTTEKKSRGITLCILQRNNQVMV